MYIWQGDKVHRCKECDRNFKHKPLVGTIKAIINRRTIFCSEGCRHAYIERNKDEFLSAKDKKEIYGEGYNSGYENGFDDSKAKFTSDEVVKIESAHNEGFIEGINIALSSYKICPRCNKRNVESLHHLLPRKYGGKDNIENLIFLCFECHDEVEVLTSILLEKKSKVDIDRLRTYVCGEFPTYCYE